MHGTPRRPVDYDPNFHLAKTFRFARASLGQRKPSGPPLPPKEVKNKHQQFVYRGGSKLHTFDKEEAPWPYAYNREMLELCGMDHAFILWAKGHQTFSDFHGSPPRRCLDLGTALGDWVVDTAGYLPECTFVGFDLVDIQIRLEYVPASIAARIQWIHGNFLQLPLPFKDNEFDYIHMEGIALGVPENKWDSLFEELNRILGPGGHIEIVQQDARFPILPRWFTGPVHAHLQQFPGGLSHDCHPSLMSEDHPHAFALLEELYFSVFDSRFINPTPTSILPGYFNTTFRQVVSPPQLDFPMPPLAPLAPFPRWSARPRSNDDTTSDPHDVNQYFVPESDNTHDYTDDYEVAPLTIDTNIFRLPTYSSPTSPTETSILHDCMHSQSQPTSPISVNPPTHQRTPSIASANRARSTSSTSTSSSPRASSSPSSKSIRARSVVVLNTNTTTRLGGEESTKLLNMGKLAKLGNDTLFMHLYMATQMVLGTKEAMWEELYKRVRAQDPALGKYGWSPLDYTELESRERFDALVGRYEQDMHIRLALWNSLVKSGWTYPRRGQMTQAELHQEEDLRRAILEARTNAKEEDFSTPARSVRLLIGVKGA